MMSKKETIIAGLIQARQQILDAVVTLPPERQSEVFLGTWSIKELLAHLVGWDYTNIDAAQDIRSGQIPRVFQHWDPNWVKYNAELVRLYNSNNFGDLLKSIQRSHDALIEMIRKIPNGEIEKDFGVRSPSNVNVTVAYFLQFEIEDEERHYRQIRDWLA